MSFLRLWSKCWNLPRSRRTLVIEAGFWLICARLAIVLVPFPWIARRLGNLVPPRRSAAPSCERSPASDVSWAIDRAASALPVTIVCLPRALTAWHMLQRRGIPARVHFGAMRDENGLVLLTHSWVDSDGVEVTGYPEANRCVEIAFFASDRSTSSPK